MHFPVGHTFDTCACRFLLHKLQLSLNRKVLKAYFRDDINVQTRKHEISSICNDFEDIQHVNSSCT